MTDEQHFEIVMPFVVCQTQGGPFEDDAYVAGWEAGRLDLLLTLNRKVDTDIPFHEDNRPQLDLIAMKHGFVAHFEDAGDGWLRMSLEKP